MNIALHGRICSGKSTVAKMLVENHGYNMVTLAKPIYTAVRLSRIFLSSDDIFPFQLHEFLCGLTDADTATLVLDDWTELMTKHEVSLKSDKKPRAFMQDWGIMFRKYDEPVFLRTALERADEPGVCDDMRMKDEAWSFRDAGWALVKIDLPEEKRLERVKMLYPDQMQHLNHQTETDLADWTDWDYVINTDCPIEQTESRVDAMLGYLLKTI